MKMYILKGRATKEKHKKSKIQLKIEFTQMKKKSITTIFISLKTRLFIYLLFMSERVRI